jgi:hypothetical protein
MAVALALLLVLVFAIPAMATTPEFDQNQDAEASVDNTCPTIESGYIQILDQMGALVWDQTDPDGSIRKDSYCFESEKLIVYAIICDDNGESDLWQHTAQAWLSPIDALISELAIVEFLSPTCALFKGEAFIPASGIWKCHHDVYITDIDKYGCTALNNRLEIYDCLKINPDVTSTFDPPIVRWHGLRAGDIQKEAVTNVHLEHVYAECVDPDGTVWPVHLNYNLAIAGTDLEGSVGVSHVIPVGNVEFTSTKAGITKRPLSNGHVDVGVFQSCEDIDFEFFVTVPTVEPGDYHGEVNLEITVQ